MKRNVKIYIHHDYNKRLFYKLFHNTNNIVVNKQDKTTFVTCDYNGINLELIFNREINDNEDGYHLLDWFSTHDRINIENPELLNNDKGQDHDYVINTELYKILKHRKNWIVSIFRTEKIYTFDYENPTEYNKHHQHLINEFSNNHILITDNFYLMDISNRVRFYHTMTNALFQWNDIINVRWFYEFKSIYDNLNFKYDLCFSVRNIKPSRIRILEGLSELNNDKIYLQVSDFLYNKPDNNEFKPNDLNSIKNDKEKEKGFAYLDKLKKSQSNIKINSIIGDSHFDDLSVLSNGFSNGLDYDLFFRYLSKAKVQVLDESWGWYKGNFPVQYLSEKTIGYILSGIPFIPTHPYPLYYIQNELGVREYPFYREVVGFKTHSKILKFLKDFLNDYDKNYKLLKDWIDEVNQKYIYKIQTENSFLKLIDNDFNQVQNIIKNKTLL